MSVPEQTTDLARAAQQVREHLHELNHEAERFEDCPVWACVLARAYLDLEARRDDDERHHEEHHEQPTSCNNSGDGYLHGGLDLCVSCRVRLEDRLARLTRLAQDVPRLRALLEADRARITEIGSTAILEFAPLLDALAAELDQEKPHE